MMKKGTHLVKTVTLNQVMQFFYLNSISAFNFSAFKEQGLSCQWVSEKNIYPSLIFHYVLPESVIVPTVFLL